MAVTDLKTEEYLPEWTTSRFIILDVSQRWAPAIHRETLQQLDVSGRGKDCVPTFHTCTTAREVLMCCEMRNTSGLILFADHMERECLSILGGLLRRMQTLPILLICHDQHENLIPVMLEAGVDTVLTDVSSDLPVSQWCIKVLQRGSGR